MAKLILQFNGATLQEIVLTQSPITIGREPGNDVVIDNLAVSRYHIRILPADDQYLVEDLESGNGTFVNEQQVTQAILRDRDQILVGKHTLVFMSGEKTAGAGRKERGVSLAEETVLVNPKILAERMARGTGQPSTLEEQPAGVAGRIAILAGGIGQEYIALTQGTTLGGKSDTADIKLKGWFVGNPAFVIIRRPEGFSITHSKGQRMTRVNGTAVTTPRALCDGDVITVGATKLQFHSGS